MAPYWFTQSSLNLYRSLSGSLLVHGCALGVALGWASLGELPTERARFAGERIVIHAVLTSNSSAADAEPVTIVPIPAPSQIDAPSAREFPLERTFPIEALLPPLDVETTQLTSAENNLTRPTQVHEQEPPPRDEPRMVPRTASQSSAASAFQPPQTWGTDVPEQPANLSSSPLPRYPREWKERGWAGTVLLKLHISATGVIEKIEVVTSSGFSELDASALNAVKHWKARPAQKAGRPISSQVNLPVVFDPGR
jgi:periplasmic protein TonB